MLTQRLNTVLSDRLARNLSWLGGLEQVQRALHLLAIIALARVFNPTDYGLISVIYTVFELSNVLAIQTGINSKIIKASEKELDNVANTAYWLNWILCGTLFIIQYFAAYSIAWFYHSDKLILPIQVLGIVYLIFPVFLVQSAFIERENKLHLRGWCIIIQGFLSSAILVFLSILGWEIWAVVFSIVLSYPACIAICYQNNTWRPYGYFSLEKCYNLIQFTNKKVIIKTLTKIQLHIEYLIVGRFLGIEALGIYFFAFNVGMGISQNIINALAFVWYPQYRHVRTSLRQIKTRYFKSFKTIAIAVVSVVILQSSLAYFYVPLIFGKKWMPVIPLLIIIACSAIPTAIYYTTAKLLHAINKIDVDLYWNLLFTIIFTGCLLIAVRGGIFWVAICVLIVKSIAMPLLAVAIARYTLKYKSL